MDPLWFLAGGMFAVLMLVTIYLVRIQVRVRHWYPDLKKYPDEEEPQFPLKVVDNPELVDAWDTIGYLTMREFMHSRYFQWSLEGADRTMDAVVQFRSPRIVCEGVLSFRTEIRVQFQNWSDAVARRRGWDVQRLHDSEYNLTWQYRTIRRAPPSEGNKPVSEHIREREGHQVH